MLIVLRMVSIYIAPITTDFASYHVAIVYTIIVGDLFMTLHNILLPRVGQLPIQRLKMV